MAAAAPWLILVPALAAALLVAADGRSPRWVADALALAATAAVAVLALVIGLELTGPETVWVGWKPRGELDLGIPLRVDGASLAAVGYTGALAALTFLFGWRHFEAFGNLYHALVLLFVTGACGFFLGGDLFNLFVFMELASVAAYGLAAYRVEDPEPVQGGLELAVVGSVGGVFLVFGVALLYGSAGRLDLAGLGAALAGVPEQRLIAAGVALVLAAFLVKSGAVPFHFAHVSAHATAPTPVLVLFSGVLLEIGIYGAARVQGQLVPGALGGGGALEHALLWLGGVGAIGCALLALLQDHVKRLLAFVSLSHVGVLVAALGLARDGAEAAQGLVLYAAGHGTTLALAFLGVGVVVAERGSASVRELWGAGRGHVVSGAFTALAALLLAGVPLTGLASGEHAIAAAARHQGVAFAPVAAAATALCGAAVLRAAARIFLGWGERPEVDREEGGGAEHADLERPRRQRPTMIAALALLAAAALATGLWPAVEQVAGRAGEALWANAIRAPRAASTSPVTSFAAAAAALVLAALSLWPERLGLRRADAALRPLRRGLHAIHGGSVGEYTAWAVLGIGALAALLAL